MSNTEKKKSERAKQEALATLGMYALERNNLESILDRAIDVSCIILHLDCAVIFSLNEKGNNFEIGAQAGCAKDRNPISSEDKNFDINFAIKQDKPTVVESYSKEKRFNISPYLDEVGIERSIHIVVKGTEDTYGVLGFYSQEYRAFGNEEIIFLQILANMIGMAIERDKLNEERDHTNQNLEEKNKQLQREISRSRQFQREILNNNLLQRWELGSYLHDNLAQILASAKLSIHTISKKLSVGNTNVEDDLNKLEEIINQGANGIRDLTQDIIPIDMEEEGINHALESLMEKTKKIHGIDCSLEIKKGIPEELNIKVATNMYFIIQEAVKNACVHGEADKVVVLFSKDQSNLKLEITDNGKGYAHSIQEDKGRGLQIMSHRMDLLGGTFEVTERDNANHSGTRITCLLPLKSLTKRNKLVKW